MSGGRNRLELTWIGKENRAKVELRILLEERERSHHAAQRVSDGDIFDNRLIFGDNLLALKALEAHRNLKRRSLFEAQDDVDRQREELIALMEAKLNQKVIQSKLFTVRWALRP
jgi:hypothetical protein